MGTSNERRFKDRTKDQYHGLVVWQVDQRVAKGDKRTVGRARVVAANGRWKDEREAVTIPTW